MFTIVILKDGIFSSGGNVMVVYLVIFAGLILLLAALLTILHRRHSPGIQPDGRRSGRYVRIRGSRQALRLLRRVAALKGDSLEVAAVHAHARPLMKFLLRTRQRLRHAPSLPADGHGEPRLMALARALAEEGAVTAQSLLDGLQEWPDAPASPLECAALPLCIAAAQCQRLSGLLKSILSDEHDRSRALRLARRIGRSKQPAADAAKAVLSPAGLWALMSTLHANGQDEPLSALKPLLNDRSATMENLEVLTTQRQIQLAEELRRTAECFDALERLNWSLRCEEADAVHQMLLEDPSGVYARLTPASRLQLRAQVERLCRRVRLDADAVLRHALALSAEAEERSHERCISYWFEDVQGLRTLHRALPTKRGRWYARYSLCRDGLDYAALLTFGLVAGFLFLQLRQPVFMLPAFALTVGGVIRAILRGRQSRELPAMDVAASPDGLRTLVVLPAVLSDAHEAIAMVRRLKTARHAFPKTGVDFMLLGDFSDSMTAVSSADMSVVQAAASAVAALSDESCHYLQRGRAWDGNHHTYTARGGRRGAVTGLCRLIAQGECEDLIAFSTLEADRLERRYDYVLVLPADRQPAPGLLETLLGRMIHPLCGRYPTPEGWRGYSILSPEEDCLFTGTGLIRPDAYLEATDGLVDESIEADPLCGELAGHASVVGAHLQARREDESWAAQYQRALYAWRLFPWQLPWVQTPMGLIRNPLKWFGRFRLRELLRDTLIPAAQCALLLWAVLTGNWLLLALALLAPEAGAPLRRWEDFLHIGCRISLLPTRAVVPLRAMADLVLRKSRTGSFLSLEVWAQGVAATLLAALGVILPELALPALILAAAFACFPLAHRALEAPLRSADGLSASHIAMLENAAAATWRFFTANVTEETRQLPPCAVQFNPPLGAESATSPEAVGAYLLGCLCAKELAYLSAREAAARLRPTLQSLEKLAMPFGLPCRRYDLASLTVQDARVDASGACFLLAALMATAQALRTWLPELSPEDAELSAMAQRIADSFDLTRLYDPEAGLFHRALDENGQGVGYVECYADAAVLLSIAACAKRSVPPAHLAKLDRACVRLNGGDIPLSQGGNASTHLLAGLFVPADETDAAAYIRCMASRRTNGLLGQDECGYWAFDPSLRYRRALFGVQEAALSSVAAGPVYAPYAAALCLPFEPALAADVLAAFQTAGAYGPSGFCDGVDCSQGAALIGVHDAFHQGLVLLAAAHVLADAPVRRYFCALPEVEACLPLLEQIRPALVLPALPPVPAGKAESPTTETAADPLAEPPDTCTLGTEAFHMGLTARGSADIYDGGIPLIRPATADDPPSFAFYLMDEGRVYSLLNPALPGQVVFAPGEVRYERLCGSLKAELICTVDTVRRRTLHILTITNLSTRDQVIGAADCLLPDLCVPANTMEADRPEKARLTLHPRGTSISLHHTVNASLPLLATGACTDGLAFTGRGRTLACPASLEEPLHDQVTSSVTPCMAFRIKAALSGRGQLTLWFTTSLEESDPPQLTELAGLRRLAALQHAAIAAEKPAATTQGGHRGVIPLPEAIKQPAPALLPDIPLLHRNPCGGFDPDTGEYVVLLEPGQTTPAPWENLHISRHYQEQVDESGFVKPHHELVTLHMEDGTVLSPWSDALPRSVRMGAGLTIWEAWSDKLDIRLCAACMPGHRFGLRVLRVRNAAEIPLQLHVLVQARLGDGSSPLEHAPGMITAAQPAGLLYPCITGSGWSARRVKYPSAPQAEDSPDGRAAVLECTLSLPPQTIGEALWLTGYVRHSEDAARALSAVEAVGASAMLHSVKAEWARLLDVVTVSTPEDTFDLLMNRILPVQGLTAEAAPVLAYLSPARAKRALLRMARSAQSRDDWARLALLIAHHARVTGDARLPDVRLSHRDGTIFACCREALLSMPLDGQGLPLGEHAARSSLLFALAARALDALHPDPALAEFSRKLLNAVDTHLWADGCYAAPLQLDIQALACAAYGSNPRTRQAVQTCWTTLYDQPHGLLRQQEATDAPSLPGLPENGGMITRNAALFLHALIQTIRTDEAHELMRALNPIHHTDDPMRAETFRCAPYRLHGGMYAAPLEAGRAVCEGGSEAAGILYPILLEDVLGLHREGQTLRIVPHVPADWEDYTLTLHEGASTWHISVERRVKMLTIDGEETSDACFLLRDDGRVHQVRVPLA